MLDITLTYYYKKIGKEDNCKELGGFYEIGMKLVKQLFNIP